MLVTSGSRLGPYEILAPLGAGGMGEVYRARDTRLGREVAVKVLPAAFSADADRLRRFEQEARAASALNDPNILAIYDVGTHGGAPYVVSELLEGETLRERLAGLALSPRKAVDYAIQIAGGLATAHDKGIVHRDLKPENLFVTKHGRVKILDFGLAKLTRPETSSGSQAEAPTVPGGTEPGVIMGTVGYMSPEQVRGQTADHRSDIFSFGAILYEMLAGRRVFGRASAADTMSAILKEEPEFAPTDPGASSALEHIVRRCLEKGPEERFQSARDLAFALRETSSISAAGRSVAEYLVSEIKRHKRGVIFALAMAVVVLAGMTYFTLSREQAIASIAVLPFINAGTDPNSEFLSDGITESLISSLSQLPSLTVMSRTSVFRYKGRVIDPQAVGRELKVQALLTGRVVQRGDALLISAELVDARNNRQLWGEQYNRRVSDIFTVQEEIAREISEKLRLKLTGVEQQRLTKRYTQNTEAYQLYLKGRYHWNRRTPEALKRSVEYFQQAIEKDPGYVLAYAGLADSYNLFSNYGLLPPKESFPRAKAAALKALEMDDQLAEAHTALARAKIHYDWDQVEAEREFKRAIELNPNYATAHYFYALDYLSPMGRHQEAIAEMRRAQELDPLSLIINTNLGWIYYFARQYDQAIEQCRKALEMDPNFVPAHARLGLAYVQKGMSEEAIAELVQAVSLSGGVPYAVANLGHAYAVLGRRGEAQKVIEKLQETSRQHYVAPAFIATIYAGLSEKERAFEWLQQAYQERDEWLILLKVTPELDSLRSDPRFADLLRRVGLVQ